MEKFKKALSDYKFVKDYAKWNESENRVETWSESVARVMDMHREKYAEKIESSDELSELINYAQKAYEDKFCLASQRSLQFGGEPTLRKNERMYNCFDVNTSFITDCGVKSFSDFAHGDKTVVLTHTGEYKPATVKSYGTQKLNSITFRRGGNLHQARATADHRWILSDGSETTSLKIGDKLFKQPNLLKDFVFDEADPMEKLYWCYGVVYGDGTINGDYSMLRLCGDDALLEKRFTDCGFKSSTSTSLSGDVFVYTGKYKKTAPNPDVDSVELIRAFVSGYLHADGNKNRNLPSKKDINKRCNFLGTKYESIQSSQKDHINFIRECFPVAGVYIISETDLTGQKTNYGVRPYTISFRINDSIDSPSAAAWTVIDIAEDLEEPVWCLEVEENHSFVMPNGMVTGNCLTSYCDRPRFFQEAIHWLLNGGGVGASVQKHHVSKLPTISKPTKEPRLFVIEDSIEGWSDAFGVLLSSFFDYDQTFPEYSGHVVHFDFSKIRPEGSLITGGFKAPGPDGLKASLEKVDALLHGAASSGHRLRPIDAYDIVMHQSDAVLSGGIRRSATIIIFSPDDEEMLNAKTGDWFVKNPQRGRSNNSALLVRGKTDKKLYDKLFDSVQQFGEPGIVWAENTEVLYNPCVEIGFMPVSPNGVSAWQGCNLTEVNGGVCDNEKDYFRAVKAAAILGTLQAGYTDFNYTDSETKATFEKEALLGVSITGWMENPEFLFDEDVMRRGAELVKETNAQVAKLIGINKAARTTCTKPSGNASVILGTSSGIHPHHSRRYLRNVQGNINEDAVKFFMKENPDAVEPSVWSATGKDVVLSFPIEAPDGSLFKDDLMGVKLLEYVKKAQNGWVEHGTRSELGNDVNLRHNISNTITVDDWDEVREYVWANQNYFAGISFLAPSGDKDYAQAPFTEVKTEEEIVSEYGVASMFASGLIVDGLNAYNDNLWAACDVVLGRNPDEYNSLKHATGANVLKRDWVRRAEQFADRYFAGDKERMTYCLKDVSLLHKWELIKRTSKDIDWLDANIKPEYVSVDTTGAVACSGGVCEINF